VNAGLRFNDFMRLEEAGLIQLDIAASYNRTNLPQTLRVRYFDMWLTLALKVNNLIVGSVMLTQAGAELVTLCDAKPCDGFVDFVCSHWAKYGVSVSPG
jgi:hypothetical protein